MATPIKNLPIMGVREFRDAFPRLTEPVRVVRASRGVEILGVWTPAPPAHKAKLADKRPPKAKPDAT